MERKLKGHMLKGNKGYMYVCVLQVCIRIHRLWLYSHVETPRNATV